PKKGLDVLLRACQILKKRHVSFECRLYGDGELKSHLQNLIDLWNLTDCVSIEEPIANQDFFSLMNCDDIFVCPSRYMKNKERDGIPVTLLEAMAGGITVVSTRVSGIPELIEHGKNGYLVRQSDPEALANILEELIGDESKRKAVSEKA